MNKKEFKNSLEVIYEGANSIAEKYKKSDSRCEKNILIGDLLELTEEIVKNNCKRFTIKYSITEAEATIEDLYSIAIAESLLDCLDWFDFGKGNNFMPMWEMFMNRDFMHMLKNIRFGKISKNTASTYLDEEINESGTTKGDLLGVEDSCYEEMMENNIQALIKDFAKNDYDKEIAEQVIKAFFIERESVRTKTFAKILGAEKYNNKCSKKVHKIRDRFRKYLIKVGFELPESALEKIK